MACCTVGCCGKGRFSADASEQASEDDQSRGAHRLVEDIAVLETAPFGIKLGVTLRCGGASGGSRWMLGRARAPPQPVSLCLEVFGGPHGDTFGGRRTIVSIPVGVRSWVHGVTDLHSDTEYTIVISAMPASASLTMSSAGFARDGLGAMPPSGHPPGAGGAWRLEVRTAPAEHTESPDKVGVKAFLKSSPLASLKPSRQPLKEEHGESAYSPSGRDDDSSTAASSLGSARAAEAPLWDMDSYASCGSVDGDSDALEEDQAVAPNTDDPLLEDESPALGVQCNLYAFFDCFSQRAAAVGGEAELVVPLSGALAVGRGLPGSPKHSRRRRVELEDAAQVDVTDLLALSPSRRAFSCRRIPFPGQAVNPAAYNLQELQRRNEAFMNERLRALAAAGRVA